MDVWSGSSKVKSTKYGQSPSINFSLSQNVSITKLARWVLVTKPSTALTSQRDVSCDLPDLKNILEQFNRTGNGLCFEGYFHKEITLITPKDLFLGKWGQFIHIANICWGIFFHSSLTFKLQFHNVLDFHSHFSKSTSRVGHIIHIKNVKSANVNSILYPIHTHL